MELLAKLDLIHAEAVKRYEFNKLLRYDNVILMKEDKEHIENICELRRMITKALNTMVDKGEYYQDAHESHYQEQKALIEKGLLTETKLG